ncbi:MAG: hypothetical protein OXT72_13715 [Gammaproteobacteria bacterium]|nr:hypothetical protein [Gammaproteobacteria bacterium]
MVLISLAQKGASTTEAGVTGHLRFNYVEIAMHPRFTVADRVQFMAGPAFAIKAGCEVSVEGDGETVEFGCDEADDSVKHRAFGLLAGIAIPLG